MRYTDLTDEQQNLFLNHGRSLVVRFHCISRSAKSNFMYDMVISEKSHAIIESTPTALTLMVRPMDLKGLSENGWVYQTAVLSNLNKTGDMS